MRCSVRAVFSTWVFSTCSVKYVRCSVRAVDSKCGVHYMQCSVRAVFST